jgi:predicted ATPase/predicted Ser/Thr protein kinase
VNIPQIVAGRFAISDPERDLLGRGGMGNVYRATDTQTGELVAVKALKPEVVAEHPDIVARFVREGEALCQLNHPNIVKMVAAVEQDGRHYLVMEYVEGGSLRELLDRQGRLPVRGVLEISLDLADALTRAHRLDIIHRDLKPANVLLAQDGTPRLTDFGVARMARTPHVTQADLLVGTVDYVSPEVCRGQEADQRSDIWGFGVMLYEMLAGERPFPGETVAAKIVSILTEPVPDLARADVPDSLADLVYRMLEKDPAQRIPSVRLVGAELEAILQERDTVSPVPFQVGRFVTPTPDTGAPRHNLPAQPTPFVGREGELTELARLLADPGVHLLTILGAGGMGKTRLALEAGAAQLDGFAHGVYFVPLAPLRSVEAIGPAVADSVGFSFRADAEGGAQADPRRQLLDYLQSKHLLLIMDNFEHLPDGAEWVTAILETAPDVKVLTTSRTRLNTQGEQVFYLGGMEFPDWETPEDALEYSAVKLFLQSARRVQPGFELQADDLRYISRICRLVQGMPLAILLAAAWVGMLSPAEIAAEIGKSADFLATDLRDVPERQRSVRAVFDYSWNLLTAREREVFQALSVFRGGFARQAAQEVADAGLRELMALVNKSLLHRTPTGRYEIHELLRQYAAEALDQSPTASAAARDRHSVYYTAALAQWMEDVQGPRQRAALEEMSVEIENARAAWNWAVGQAHVDQLNRAADGLFYFYWQRVRFQEGESAFREAAERLAALVSQSPDVPGDVRLALARLESRHSIFGIFTNIDGLAARSLQRAWSLLQEAKSVPALLQGVRQEEAFILWRMAWQISDRIEARRLYEQSLERYRTLGDRWRMAWVLRDFGQLVHDLGDYEEAGRLSEESLAIRRALGDQIGTADSLWRLSITAWVTGRLEESERLAREGLAICQEIGDPQATALGLRGLGESLIRLGKFAESLPLLEKSRAAYDDLAFYFHSVSVDLFSCEANAHLGRYERARSLGQAPLDFFRAVGFPWGIGFYFYAVSLAALGVGAYAEAQQSLLESISNFDAIGHRENKGWALALLGYTCRALGQPDQARRYVAEALQTWADIGAFFPLIYALPAAALLLADRGEHERAVEVYALASRYGFVANSRWFEDVAGRYIAAAAAAMPPEVVAAAQERGRVRDLGATVAELLVGLGE